MHKEPDEANPRGMKRTAHMRPGVNSDRVYPGSKTMPSVHKRNSQDSQFAVSEGNDPYGMKRPCTCEGPNCNCG
jgi:hypothetical protein